MNIAIKEHSTNTKRNNSKNFIFCSYVELGWGWHCV